ncbi:unnamed protein product [Adineta ricciae]|uniref:Uncharacterized protein n=1 Tax=Adineta ricciae TaxID=249248 RepID=A0A815JN52_ADIRI|nr:unnamed protein product [Adineta ricciae]CAF1427002.1 unnamed protein product [Adineta ricciae]
MFAVFTLLLSFHFSIAFDPRLRRFLNSEVHNRMNVLEQAHSTHRNETDWMRTIFLAIAIGFGLILLLVFLTIVYCNRTFRFVAFTSDYTTFTEISSTSSTSLYAQSTYPYSTVYPSQLPVLKF